MENENIIIKTLREIPAQCLKVITQPVVFFKEMPKTGGFLEPLIFMIILGIVTSFLRIILAVFGFGISKALIILLSTLIITPIIIAIFGFIVAGILYIIWNIMGSKEDYETAYRCCAYIAAISPITTLLSIIPYLGTIASSLWVLYLLVIISKEVHTLLEKKAWIVFGIILSLLCVLSLSAQIASRRFLKSAQNWQNDFEEMTPEEKGKALGNFFKGMEEGSKNQ
ncbi:YIP1 family protein [Chlamydiota bacterium]